jgi:recombination protein RecA
MDQKKFAQIMSLCKEISTKQGEGSIYSLGSKTATAGIPRWSTYIEDLDNVLGGGMPKGRMIEIFGPESSGKTSLAYYLCSLHEVCLFIPAEGTFDADRATQFGNRPKQLLVYRECRYAEDIMDKIFKFSKAGIPFIVVDSVPGMVPKAQYELVEKDPEKQPQRGQLPAFFSRTLKNLEDIIEHSGTTVVFINQVRDKMDAMMFGEKTQTPGGHALRHYASVRIQVGRKAWIEVPNKNPANTSETEKVGLITACKVVKSKICNPFGMCELPMFFSRSYCSHDDIKTIRAEIMTENNKKYKGGK